MKIITRIKKIGGTFYAQILENQQSILNLAEDDLVEINIKKLDKKIIKIRCPNCRNTFDAEDLDVLDCIFCEKEILRSGREALE